MNNLKNFSLYSILPKSLDLVGDNMSLMLDRNHGYSLQEAILVGQALDANNFYAPNLPSSAALKEAQSDNRLGGSKTAYKKNYKPIDPRKQPRPYNSIWDIFRN